MAAPNLESAAQKFIKSYADAMALAQTSTPLPTITTELAKHYLPSFTAFALGNIMSAPDSSASVTMIQGQLDRLEKSGLGCDIRMVKNRVEVAGRTSVLCFITWKIIPAEGWKGAAAGGKEGWEFENCYFFRQKMDGTQGFEGVISDGEIQGLLERVPTFFS